MDMENSYGQMGLHIKVNSLITIFTVLASILGLIIVNLMAIGTIIKCMERVYLPGLMEGNT